MTTEMKDTCTCQPPDFRVETEVCCLAHFDSQGHPRKQCRRCGLCKKWVPDSYSFEENNKGPVLEILREIINLASGPDGVMIVNAAARLALAERARCADIVEKVATTAGDVRQALKEIRIA